VVVVAHGVDGEFAEFAGAGAGVPRDGDEGGVAVVPRGLDHGKDVVVPVEHIARVGHGRAVSRGRRRDLLEDLRHLVAVGDVPAEHPEGTR
jgi:hypothetical protein